MNAGRIANIANTNSSIGRNIISKNDIPNPQINIVKSILLKYPNISKLFFEFAGIKYELFI
jgi:hypothetical protein